MKKSQNKSGFTLIELLVVITIIGILATGAVNIFTTQLQAARDATRIADMKVTELALHSIFNEESEYPTAVSMTGAIKPYISKVLKDKKTGKSNCYKEVTGGGAESTAVCEGYYNVADDSFNLTNASFKISVRFEKKKNFLYKAKNNGKDGDGGNSNDFFEVYAGAGSDLIPIGATASGVIFY